jgi:nucleotide-binding universal stress UspA family protein
LKQRTRSAAAGLTPEEPLVITLKTVLVATDLGNSSQATVDYARSVASAFSATLHVVHVVDDVASRAMPPPDVALDFGRLQTEREDDARRRLDSMVKDPTNPKDVMTAVLTSRRPASAILAYAQDAHVDLIIAGTHSQRGVIDLFMGSVAQELVRHAGCPVLTMGHSVDSGPTGAPAAA